MSGDKLTACPSGCNTATMMLNAASGFQVRYVQCGCGWRSQEYVDPDGAVAEQKATAAWNRHSTTELVEALRRISEMSPAKAGANTALQLHWTVKAIAESALTLHDRGER